MGKLENAGKKFHIQPQEFQRSRVLVGWSVLRRQGLCETKGGGLRELQVYFTSSFEHRAYGRFCCFTRTT